LQKYFESLALVDAVGGKVHDYGEEEEEQAEEE